MNISLTRSRTLWRVPACAIWILFPSNAVAWGTKETHSGLVDRALTGFDATLDAEIGPPDPGDNAEDPGRRSEERSRLTLARPSRERFRCFS